jgi:hypothetical protein
MQNYILYSDVDQEIIDKMANQAPDVNKRLRAINSELKQLQAEYDLFDAVRKVTINVKTDGLTAYDVSTLVTDNDIKSIKDFDLGDSNTFSGPFTYLDHPEFIRRASRGGVDNYYTLYVENGIQYLKLVTVDISDTAMDVDMTYHTTMKALDNDDDFIPLVVNDVGVKILLPARFQELISLGAVRRLFYPSIGEDADIALRRIERDYSTAKQTLGLTSAKFPVRPTRKINLRPLVQ